MKKLALIVLALGVCSFAAMAAQFTGVITDSMCASAQGQKAASPDHAGCASACIKKGSPAVLMTQDGKVYKLDDQAKVVAHAGHKVTINGTLEGDTIKIASVKM